MLRYVIVNLLICSAIAQNLLARSKIGHSRSASVDYQLPSTVKPNFYQLELEPDFDTDTFLGSINITFYSKSTQNKVTLHALDLEIDSSTITLLDENGNTANLVLGTSYSDDDREFYTITFAEALEEGGTYILLIGSFTGILNNDNYGFYLAKYINEEGVIRKLATTHFEPTSARRAFPCFDEPALKAVFEISIIRTEEYNSISNAELVKTESLSGGRFKDVFARTPIMSTYLVAFVVSDFTFVVENNKRVFGKPSTIAAGKGDYALKAGINILNVLEEYLDEPYHLSKMDQIGIPYEYFAAGAMENWGLVTYRDEMLFFNPKIYIAEIVAHEFGHQWFGNNVSPLWWSYIWLSEGFATYFQYYASSIQEDYDMANRIVPGCVQYALYMDSFTHSRPMNQDAGSPKDIIKLFDVIAYQKSGSVIRMVEGILSREIFRRGLIIYQNKMKFKAAKPSDLYSSWQQALDEANVNPLPEDEDIESVMTTWDSKSGYPLLTVNRNYTEGTVTISQKRFILIDATNDDESIWYIPISYATQSNINFTAPTPRVWLTERSTTIELNDLQADDWIIVNIQESGFYRVNYDKENWYRIKNLLGSDEADQIHPANKAQIIDDSFQLAMSGLIDFSIYLSLSQSLVRETAYASLQSFVNAISSLDSRMSSTEIYGDFRKYVLSILETAFKSVGLDEKETDKELTKLNRKNIATWICAYEHEDCREYALRQLREWKLDESKVISSYLQVPLVCTAMRLGKQSDWTFVFERYITARDPVHRANLLRSLGCIENKSVLNRYMKKILESRSYLASPENLAAFSSIYASGNFGKSNMRNYIGTDWSLLKKRFTPSQLSSIINQVASKLTTEKQLAEMEDLARKVNAESIFKRGIETLKSNIIWTEKYLPSITAYLNERN